MRLHRRTSIVQKARSALDLFLLDLEHEHKLTYGEIFSLLGETITHFAKSAVQQERHPDDPDKRGDEA